MILQVEEKIYRARPELSQTQLKDYWENPREFYKKHILREKVSDDDEGQTKPDQLYGSVVDALISDEHNFDYRFMIGDVAPPKGQMLKFTEELYKKTRAFTNSEGVLTISMNELYDMAYPVAGFVRDGIDKVKERFTTEGLDYYQFLRDRGDRMAITQTTYEKAHYLVEKLREHPYSSGLINLTTNDRWTVYDQIMMTGVINEVEMRGMFDRLIVDEVNKIVYPWDYKVGSNADMFLFNYTKLKYYIQLGIYTELARQNFPGYNVLPLRFLAVDRTMYYDPIKWKMQEGHVDQAYSGFVRDGFRLPGITEMLQNYKYAKDNDYWTGKMKAHQGKGDIEMELFTPIK